MAESQSPDTQERPTVDRRSWSEFRESGLLCWVNRLLHLFGWAIVIDIDDGGKHVSDAYPAHCRFRGFGRGSEDRMFRQVTKHLRENLDRIETDLPQPFLCGGGHELPDDSVDACGQIWCAACNAHVTPRIPGDEG